MLGGMSSRWERGAEGGDCYNGADKAKQQEVSTNTNTITNTNTVTGVPTLHLRYNNYEINVTIMSSAALCESTQYANTVGPTAKTESSGIAVWKTQHEKSTRKANPKMGTTKGNRKYCGSDGIYAV